MKPLTIDEIRRQGSAPALRRALLADFLDGLPQQRFDMSIYRVETDCGTVGCIAGWAVELFGWHTDVHSDEHFEPACDLLGLNPDAYPHLFLDTDIRTPQEAASRLRAI